MNNIKFEDVRENDVITGVFYDSLMVVVRIDKDRIHVTCKEYLAFRTVKIPKSIFEYTTIQKVGYATPSKWFKLLRRKHGSLMFPFKINLY